ncbi:alpha-mannosidase [Tetragenococcus halophilus]|uniref:Alpha-mannosidase n=1 Tax=Tetragenococcus halophilus TaxID=51669 RepID=A0AB35HUP3_TETHA|nr:alpha-mannosidase [Tetragenococcus halophilus]MCO8299157.1 alpha-mannosidase [Tetragenococcus halophilus]
MRYAHVVQHTHWDREWYFTNEDAIVLSDQVFTEVLDELERNPEANFCLDGQTSVVDEYLEIHPEKLTTIQQLITEKRLFVGPWYAQTDALFVDAESILRNLTIGITDTINKYGDPMKVGYLPDTFGFNAQLPTLLKHADIDNFIFWRGIDFNHTSPSPYFKWKGLGNKSVYAINFPFGYMTGLLTLEAQRDTNTFVEEKLDPSIKFLSEKSGTGPILVPSGIDQKNIVLNIQNVIEKINQSSQYQNVISDYPTFVNEIKKENNLPQYQGELREPVYARVHRSIGSIRSQFKLNNFQLEQTILRRVEPLMVIAKSVGLEISNTLLSRLWKKVLENQAHDSLGGCVSDNVVEDILHRTKEAEEIAEGIENLITKRIADALELDDNQVLVFNTDIAPFKGQKKVHIVSRSKNIHFTNGKRATIIQEKYYPERKNVQRETSTGNEYITEPSYFELDVLVDVEILALGYTVIEFEEVKNKLPEKIYQDEQSISNHKYTLSFIDGEVVLTTESGKKVTDFLRIVDCGNEGDTYDFSPLANEKEAVLNFQNASSEVDEFGQSLIIHGSTDLPLDLDERMKEDGKKQQVDYSLILRLTDEDDIEGKVIIDNQVLSHRMRLQIQADDSTGKSIAQIQNGFVENKFTSVPEDWKEHYVEKPVNLQVLDKSVTVKQHDSHLIFFSDGMKEYERNKDKLYVTLFAATGQLGKADISWRPGRASGDTTKEGHIMMPTPLAQEKGEREFTFALKIEEGLPDYRAIAQTASKRLTPSISYQKQNLNLFMHRLDNKIWPQENHVALKNDYSAFQLETVLSISAIYPSYTQDNAFVLRLANPKENEVKLPSEFMREHKMINAIEEEVERENIVHPFDYVSYLVEL